MTSQPVSYRWAPWSSSYIPAGLLARAAAVSLVDASEMMRDDVFYGSYFNRARVRLTPDKLDSEPYFKWLSHFERFLRNKAAGKEPLTVGAAPGPFLLGADICYADVAVYDCVMGIWAMDLFDEAAGRARSPLLCVLVDAVGGTPGIRAHEEARGTRREYYAQAEAAWNRRFAAKQAAKQSKL